MNLLQIITPVSKRLGKADRALYLKKMHTYGIMGMRKQFEKTEFDEELIL